MEVIKDNLIYIPDKVIMELKKGNGIKSVIVKESKAPINFYNKKAVNFYIELKDYKNLVLMHVCNNYFIFINKSVITKSGQEIDLVNEVKQYYWGIGVNGARRNDGTYIWREIMRIIENGKNGAKLQRNEVVHHKDSRSYNTQDAIELKSSQAHRNYHSQYGQQSHRKGKVISDIDAFDKECKKVLSVK